MKAKKLITSLFPICLLILSGCNKQNSKSDEDQYQEGYRTGYQEGYSDAEKDFGGEGYNEGYNAGYDAGYEQGKEDAEKEKGAGNVRPGYNVDIHTDLQAKYIAGNPSNISNYATGYVEASAPNSVTLDFSTVNFPVKSSYKVRLSENEDLSNYKEIQTTSTSTNITNLKLGTTYYWCVLSESGTSTYYSQTFTFSTKQTVIRNIYVPGTSNWRDLGNYETSDGKRIKQGLLYRSAAFNYDNGQSKTTLSQDTINTIKYELGIKSDIDLTGVNGIDGITRYYYRMEYSNISNLIDDEGNQKSIKKVFDTLGDSTKYPAVFHCTRGRDRTGAVAFLLGAYLGMNKDDLTRDYLFTNFSGDNYCNIDAINNYFKYMNQFEGEDLRTKTKNYLLGIGVAEQTLTNIDSILK